MQKIIQQIWSRCPEIYSTDAEINGLLNVIHAEINGMLNVILHFFFKYFPQSVYIAHEIQKMQSLYTFLSHWIPNLM